MTLPRFYPIFDSADWLRRALPLGVKLVQIRIKDQPAPQLLGELALAQELCREHGATLVVNDHWQAALDLGCDFIHLGQEDLDTADFATIRRAGMRLGISTHDHAELDRAFALAPDYVALGPVWPTILKKMKWEQQGLERVGEWRPEQAGAADAVQEHQGCAFAVPSVHARRTESGVDVECFGLAVRSVAPKLVFHFPEPALRLRAAPLPAVHLSFHDTYVS